jgi:hypothetical protein
MGGTSGRPLRRLQWSAPKWTPRPRGHKLSAAHRDVDESMGEIIFGQYETDENAPRLRHIITGQSITLIDKGAQGALGFEYADAEVTVPFYVKLEDSVGIIDFAHPETRVIARNYGLWRRMTYFLLDALVVWLFPPTAEYSGPHRRIDAIGGWRNGAWDPLATLQAAIVWSKPENAHAAPKAEAHVLCPLDAKPLAWTYVEPKHIEAKIELGAVPNSDGIQVLASIEALELKLAGAPRFVREDRGAFLYHSCVNMNFHRGEDYDPIPFYGYANRDVAFTIGGQTAYGLGLSSVTEPILLRPDVAFETCFTRWLQIGSSAYFALSPALLEEFIFALVDIAGVMEAAKTEFPFVREHDRDQWESAVRLASAVPIASADERRLWRGSQFGRHLDNFLGLTLGSPFGMAHTYLTRHLHPLRSAAELRKLGYKRVKLRRRGLLSKLWPF